MIRATLFAPALALWFSLGMWDLAIGQEEETNTPDMGPTQSQQMVPNLGPQPAIFVPQGNVVTPGLKVAAAGGGDISNSWGGGEFSGEVGTTDDVFYQYHYARITYFVSAGDTGWGAQYPSSSPWVVSAVGTTINRDSSGSFVNESCWSGSGGGVSAYEKWQSPPNILNGMGPWADYQHPFAGQTARQTPDIAFDADPNSGANVYNSFGYGGWVLVGGTSLASIVLASMGLFLLLMAQANGQGTHPGANPERTVTKPIQLAVSGCLKH